MKVFNFSVCYKTVTLYASDLPDMPLVVYNSFDGDGSEIVNLLNVNFAEKFNFLNVSGVVWNDEMSPWYCEPVFSGERAFTGGADKYLGVLTTEIIPKAESLVRGKPSYMAITGYSLAGLFAVYASVKTSCFKRAASVSGSLWFPKYKEYITVINSDDLPEKLYLSLGDKESKVKNPILKTVLDNTLFTAESFKALGVDVTFELNPGNHFKDEALRVVKAVSSLLDEF